MAVKYPKKFVPRSYFTSSNPARKSTYNLRNSNLNLSQYFSPTVKLTRLSPSMVINKDHTERNIKKIGRMQEKKKVYNLRKSDFNVSYNETLPNYITSPKRTAKSIQSTPKMKNKNPIKKSVSTQRRKKESNARNSSLSTSHNSRPKRTANCIEYTPNVKTEHPMRKKLRKLACFSTPKKSSVTHQIVSMDLDLKNAALTRNQRKVFNITSSKFVDCENSLQASKKLPLSRISTKSTSLTTEVSEKCNKTLKICKEADSSVMKDAKISECNVKKQKTILKIKNSKPLGKDDLVLKEKALIVESSSETPVMTQMFSRSLRNKDNSKKRSAEKSILRHKNATSISNRDTNKIITELKDPLTASYSDVATPVTTRLKKITSDIKIPSDKPACFPERSHEKNYLSIDSVLKSPAKCVGIKRGKKNLSVKTSSSNAELKVIVKGKEQVERKKRGKSIVFENDVLSTIGKRITRSTTLNIRDELFTKGSSPKKSKRHTFPNSKKCSKAKNQLRLFSLHDLTNVPLDVLTEPGASFYESQTHTSKTDYATKISSKTSLEAKNDVSIKTPIPKTHLREKKIVKLPEQTSDSKKVPAIGTLKRKRWIMNTLKEKSEGHEDDIFENKKIEFPKPIGFMFSDDESDGTDVSIATPTCGFLLTPNISRKTPIYKPCISSTDLKRARRVAEEYLYRRNRTLKQACKKIPENRAVTSENNKVLEENTEYSEALANVLKAQANIEKLTEEESEEEDEYFSDVS